MLVKTWIWIRPSFKGAIAYPVGNLLAPQSDLILFPTVYRGFCCNGFILQPPSSPSTGCFIFLFGICIRAHSLPPTYNPIVIPSRDRGMQILGS